ncbi:DNA translocase FtsK 4TM domain-containing protein [Dokdonella sp.]|uniref:DNA translocase FtsK n=2 Tax=Dokdonella sp. TaxID=2291710 RepID=UPI002D0DEC50|nr:DNA translocase FtsK 4TM domain-containing protein [Dokdonella sp.]HOX71464.1 DNA translocase FtsK 4TM domain-containing protein [Dokdonella sp.]HPN79272.1 DNA translocase FtsK 4TM domain-containing protein [Dokdonella sp.]
MARESKTQKPTPPDDRLQRRLREVGFLLLLPLAVYLFICLWTYSPADWGWSHVGEPDQAVVNFGGKIGAYLADLLFYFFGVLAYAFPALLLMVGTVVLRGSESAERAPIEPTLRLVGSLAFFVAGSGLAHLHFDGPSQLPAQAGGVLGTLIGGSLIKGFGFLGGTLFLLALFLIAITLATGLSWFRLMDWIGRSLLALIAWARDRSKRAEDWSAARQARVEREVVRKVDTIKQSRREPLKIEPTLAPIGKSERAKRETQIPLFVGSSTEGEVPPLALLDEPKQRVQGYSQETLDALSRQVEFKLKDFRIDAQVVSAHPGPVITRFEMQPAPGIKGSQISSLDKDIARGLSVISVRVVDVIPGKSVIGLEIPNVNREIVYLSEILRSDKYDQMKSPLALALGKDIGGAPIVVDLAKMPHLLVAGTTGSGKSVALNAMVLSLLYKANATDVRMIMIDPKMLELSVYEGIPHLLAPVVTDMKEAANALRWCVAEMERRYKLMAAVGVRNLAGFNKKVRDEEAKGQPLLDPLFRPDASQPSMKAEPLKPLPYIVVIIDEFADMMMIVGKKVEELIARLAQKARAAGVHLILATQRPSVDVITGLIKANIPTRIAFQVSSKIDSRTILDQSGAETLLGHGDMLYLPPGTATPERVHGAFVDDHEVHKVVEWLRAQGKPDYIDGVLEETQTLADGKIIGETGLPQDASEGEGGEDAALYDKAVRIVTETRRASISGVQRHLRIGYNRAARLIEQMERDGVVSGPEHNGNRTVIAPPPPRD